MPHFFINENEINSDFINLTDKSNLHHIIQSRRAKLGEKIKFIDENYYSYECEIFEISKNYLKAKILNKEKSKRFLKHNICLIQSILASDAQNQLIANATQTGVKEIFPVISDNVANKKFPDKKNEKWNKIVLENFKQCERADIAKINNICPLIDVISTFKKENVLIFAEKLANISIDKAICDVDKKSKIAIVIGPEGGFSDNEFQYFVDNKFKLISLGNMIYKAPTAVVAAISGVVGRIEWNLVMKS